MRAKRKLIEIFERRAAAAATSRAKGASCLALRAHQINFQSGKFWKDDPASCQCSRAYSFPLSLSLAFLLSSLPLLFLSLSFADAADFSLSPRTSLKIDALHGVYTYTHIYMYIRPMGGPRASALTSSISWIGKMVRKLQIASERARECVCRKCGFGFSPEHLSARARDADGKKRGSRKRVCV